MDADKGLLGTLFDFSFSSFITTKVVKLLFAIGVLFCFIGSIQFIRMGFWAGAGWGVLALLISPLVFLIFVLINRVLVELLIVLFRIAEDVRRLAGDGGAAEVVTGGSVPPAREAEIVDDNE